MEKVKFLDVARKTWLMLSARATIYGGYATTFFCLLFLPHLLFAPYDPEVDAFPTFAVVSGLINLVLLMATSLSMQHFTIASCRNATSFFPERKVATVARYTMTTIVLVFITMAAMTISGMPLFAVLASGMMDNGGILGLALIVACGILAGFGIVPGIRLSMILPAIAIGDEYGYKRTWRMTKGYTLKLLCLTVAMLIPSVVLGLIWGIIWGSPDNDPVLFNGVNSAFSVVTSIIFGSYYGILYQDLVTSYDGAAAAESESEFGFENEDD